MHFETISLDRARAAAVVGITEPQIANWVTKYGLFPEKRQGKGAHFFFLFSDVIALATIKALLDAGITAPTAVDGVGEKLGKDRLHRSMHSVTELTARNDDEAAAVAAVRPYSPYGVLLHSPAVRGLDAGTFFLSQNHEGRWVGFTSPDVKVSLQVRMWAVFDDVFPRFCEQIREYAKAMPADRLEEIIEHYRSEMHAIRQQRDA